MSIKIISAGLDTFTRGDGKETLVIRGVIAPESLHEIQVAAYQREIGATAKLSALARALKTSSVPDVELGMRGDKTRNTEAGRVFYLQDPTYVIDGLQRISAAKFLLQKEPTFQPRIGCLVHTDTTYEWETERFRILNQERSRLSINVLLRNQQHDKEVIGMLYALCDDPAFVMKGRVCWQQRMTRNQLISAMLLCKITGILHSRFGPGRSNNGHDLIIGLEKIMTKVTRHVVRKNLMEFFRVVDICFNLRNIVISLGAAQTKTTFLVALAEVFSRCDVFWDGGFFTMPKELETKLKSFPIHDPEINRLASSGGAANKILSTLLVDHLNRGKRTKRLVVVGFEADEDEDD